jgi:hypothetical protein
MKYLEINFTCGLNCCVVKQKWPILNHGDHISNCEKSSIITHLLKQIFHVSEHLIGRRRPLALAIHLGKSLQGIPTPSSIGHLKFQALKLKIKNEKRNASFQYGDMSSDYSVDAALGHGGNTEMICLGPILYKPSISIEAHHEYLSNV